MRFRHVAMLLLISGLVASASLAAEPKKLLLLGQGPDGHPPTTHEYLAGSRILAKCLKDVPGALPAPVRAGSIVVLSSLTPHRTGPNRSDSVRKAYIVQFAPDGAVCFRKQGEGWERVSCDAPERQYRVLQHGQRVVS